MQEATTLIEEIKISDAWTLDEYAAITELTATVSELKTEAGVVAPHLKGRTVWMINSTAQGGGVAEMMPKMISIFRELDCDVRWAVINTDEELFFSFTKRLHNMIHGIESGEVSAEEREVYERVNRENADDFKRYVQPGDVVVIHDPQPMAMGAYIKKELGVYTIWRCHIGLDQHNTATRTAWTFLKQYADVYDHSVFSAPEYIPDYLAGRSTIICPAIDPLSHKNRELTTHKLMGILCNSHIARKHQPVLTEDFEESALRLRSDGEFADASGQDEIGLLYRPIISQISRWDRLKGFAPLMRGFIQLKRTAADRNNIDERHRRRLQIVRMVLAGPDPRSIQDDPEGQEVLKEICDLYTGVDAEIQKDIGIFALPMKSRKENALMVNAIQRCSTVIAQNSVQEGFGLTATEAMWKGVPVMTSRACGLRQQVRDGVDGRMVSDADDVDQIAHVLDTMLANPHARADWGRNGRRRATEEFLVFSQIKYWLRLLDQEVAHAHA
ncbi:MAG: glycosyltransferase [Leptospiraceae bacterium]|nr:glycosyltransferase [Leptospiraceae bacterium]